MWGSFWAALEVCTARLSPAARTYSRNLLRKPSTVTRVGAGAPGTVVRDGGSAGGKLGGAGRPRAGGLRGAGRPRAGGSVERGARRGGGSAGVPPPAHWPAPELPAASVSAAAAC